nr:hypothetical protein [Planctomycetales bacterium]
MMINNLPFFEMLPLHWVPAETETEFAVIGYIIPGLIAIWIDRQGLVETLCALITASVVIRLILIMIYGVELNL